MTEYTIPYARFLLRSWGFTRKVPVGRHVKRASRQKIAWFCKKLGPLIEERTRAGYTACVQDEAICVADARFRKGVYTPKGVRGVYTYMGSHSKTILRLRPLLQSRRPASTRTRDRTPRPSCSA